MISVVETPTSSPFSAVDPNHLFLGTQSRPAVLLAKSQSVTTPPHVGVLSLPSTLGGVDVAMRDIVAAIARLERRQRALREHRNTLIPIGQLPPEVLIAIFRELQPGPHEWDDASWLSVTFVCRFWRNTALNDGVFWSRPVFHRPPLALAMLDRAHHAPLVIRVEFGKGTSKKSLRAVRQALTTKAASVTEISLTGKHEHLIKLSLRHPFPIVKRIRLNMMGGSLLLAEDFLGGTAPLLRSITLENGTLACGSPLIGQLTRLVIHNVDQGPTAQYSLGDLLTLLDGTPQLIELSLHCAILLDSLTDPMSIPRGIVNLRSLEAFDLQDFALSALILLEHLRMSPDTLSFDVRALDIPPTDEALHALMAFMRAHLARATCAPETLEMSANDAGVCVCCPLSAGGSVQLRLSLDGAQQAILFATAADVLGLAAGLRSVGIRTIGGPALARSGWAYGLGRAPALEDITVSGDACDSFVAALAVGLAEGDDGSSDGGTAATLYDAPAFAALRSATMIWDNPEPNGRLTYGSISAAVSALARLVTALRHRDARGTSRLRRLTLFGAYLAHVDEEVFSWLRPWSAELVVNVPSGAEIVVADEV